MGHGSYSEVTLQPGRTPGSGLQGARRKDPATGRRRGWAAEPSLRKSQRMSAPLEKGPGAAAGALLICSGGEPGEPGCPDCVHLVVVEQADAAADHAEDAAGDEEPRLGVDVAVGVEDTLLLAAADQRREEVVHLAHVLAHILPQLRILGRLAQRLHPQLRELGLAVADAEMAAAHRLEARTDVRRVGDRFLPRRARLRPDEVEGGEVEVALRREVPVQDRLRDACGACDLRRRRPAVAAFREDTDRGLDELETALRRGQAGRGLHAAISAMCACSVCGLTRTRATATAAAAKAMSALTSSAACRPSTYCCFPSGVFTGTETYEARMAPITAIPSAPPTCRKLFSTPEPTPALSIGTAPMAAEVIGDITNAMPTPPSTMAGSSVQNVECSPTRW